MCRAVIVLVLVAGFATPGWAQEPAGIRAVYQASGVPVLPDDPVWQSAPEFGVTLFAQQILPPHGGGAVARVGVRAIHDGLELGLRFEWADATENREVGMNTFRDAVAVGFPTRQGETLPSPFMGDAEHPINVWQWTADFDANAQGKGGFAARYPHTEGVWYFPQDYSVTREVRSWRGTEPVIELVATGWATLERKASQNVRGIGVHGDGTWQVVLRRQVSTGNPEDTLFRAGENAFLILAVWDGAEGEVNGKKSVTLQWHPLLLDATVAAED